MKKAFTLAEVLITLGIIGVVAAITMPVLIAKHQRQEIEGRLKKVYSVLSQAMIASQADNGNASEWVDTSVLARDGIQDYFDKHWAPYIKILRYCDSQTTCGYKSNIKCWNGSSPSISLFGGSRISFLTSDGMYILLRSIGTNSDGNYVMSTTQQIFVDVNAGRGPNVFGKDVFLFIVDLNNPKINPYGYSASDSVVDEACYSVGKSYLSTCAAKIMREGWKINYW